MGVSTQYGVLQSTRVGDLDPFSVLYVMAQEGWSPTEITRQLMEDSGLKGISGISGDMILAALIDLGVENKHIVKALKKIDLKGYKFQAKNVQRNADLIMQKVIGKMS